MNKVVAHTRTRAHAPSDCRETHSPQVHPRVPAAFEAGESATPLSELGAQLRAQYKIEAVVFKLTDPVDGSNSTWFRLSSQVYVEKADFVKLGDAVLALLAEGGARSGSAL